MAANPATRPPLSRQRLAEIAWASSPFPKVGVRAIGDGLPLGWLWAGIGRGAVKARRSEKLNSVLLPNRLPRHSRTADITRCCGLAGRLYSRTTTGV